MKRFFIFILLSTLLSSISNAADIILPTTDRRPIIEVTGQGEVKAVPNIATVDLEVTQESAVIPPAVEAVRATMNRIYNTLKTHGVAESDIRTETYTVYPKTEWINGKSQLTGYTVTDRIKVTIRNLKDSGQILADAVSAGANLVNGLQFNLENKEKYEARALAKAVENAKEKALSIAEASGMRLGNPIYFSESSYVQPPIRPFYRATKAMAQPAAPEPISPGEEVITATVNATFLMGGK